jgi:hypothetical protein
MKVRMISLLACASLAVAAPVLAHHSFSGEYDSTKPITLTGKVTKVEWTNPHARFYIDVKGDDGQTTNWNLELASPNVLKRQGWASNSLKEGDVDRRGLARAQRRENGERACRDARGR